MPSLSAIVDETDRRAEDLEEDFRRLATGLFAIELAFLIRALSRAGSETAVVNAMRAATLSYRSRDGLFRKNWENGFTELLTESALREARRKIPVTSGSAPTSTTLPRSATQAIETRAAELAESVAQSSAARLEAATGAIAREVADRRPDAQPATPDAAKALAEQRLRSLAPLVGRNAAGEIMSVIQAGQSQSVKKVATTLVKQVHSTEVTAVRATRIARTESIGLVNLTQYEKAVGTGILREKRWIHQNDGRVRDSHIRCGAEGWIPISERFSNGLAYPGERPGPPEELINCRCAIAFRAAGAPSEAAPPRQPPRVTITTPEPDDQSRSMLEGGQRTSLEEHTVNGQVTPERQRVHDRIVDAYFREQNASPVTSPRAFMTGGGGASGKSTIIAKLNLPQNILVADADRVRVMLPEWNRELAAARAAGRKPNELLAAYTHDEASLINKRIVEQATLRRFNLLVDTVGGGGIEKLTARVNSFRAGGAPVVANYVTIDYDEAYRRMRLRGDKTGRYVPATVLREQHDSVVKTFYDAIRRGLFDEFTLWDNSGSEPVIVARGRGSQLEIVRQDLWDKFVVRAKGFETTGQ